VPQHWSTRKLTHDKRGSELIEHQVDLYGGPALSHSTTASGSDSWEQRAAIEVATLLIAALMISLGSLLRHRRRRRRMPLVPPAAICVAPSNACKEGHEPSPLATNAVAMARLGHLQSLAR
jgi:hypothetical protein